MVAGVLVKVGDSLSITAIVCDPVLDPPQTSVTVYVLTRIGVPLQSPGSVLSTKVRVVLPQASWIAGSIKLADSPQLISILGTRSTKVGGKLFFNLKCASKVVLFPQSSVAEKNTSVIA